MDAEKNVVPRDEGVVSALMFLELEKLPTKVRRYYLFLSIASVIAVIAPRLAPASRPSFVPFLPAGYGLPVTCATFTVATVVLQLMLARVLETTRRRPAPAAAPLRLTWGAAWQVGIATWVFATMFFRSYICFGGDRYFVRSCNERAAADLASSANLFFITLTVVAHLT